MKRFVATIALTSVALIGVVREADAFTSRKAGRVNPVNDLVFEVVPKNSTGQDIWCGAGDYAHRALNAPWQARVFVFRGRAQSETTGRRTSVQFTLNAEAAGITPVASSFSINSFAVGESMSVQQAFGYCQKTFPF